MATNQPSNLSGTPGPDERTDSIESFERDLHGDNRAGQHGGVQDLRTYSADDVKDLHESLPDFDNAELKRIPILAHGERLEQGGVYLDLRNRAAGPFTAQGSVEAQDPHLYVPKAACDYEMWNKLLGINRE